MGFNSKYTGAQVEAWLDNIKNYSANDILEKLKTVDGSNSGLDADLLDGKQPSELNVGSATKLQTARIIWGQSFDGTGNVSGNLSLGAKSILGHSDKSIITSEQYFLKIGQGSSTAGVITRIHGNSIELYYGTSNSLGLVLTQYGAIELPNSVFFNRGKEGIYIYGTGISWHDSAQGYIKSLIAFSTTKMIVTTDLHSNGAITQDSDINLKNRIKDVVLSIDDIAEAPLFEFTYKSDKDKRIHVGTSAQYWVEKNNWFCKKQDNGYYDMEIQNLALASAISIAKEFKKYKEESESTINNMKKEIEELKQLVLNMNK